MLRQTLKGTGVALVTPFKKDKSIDFTALENIIDIQIAGGVDYIVTLGTTGESVVLSEQEKIEVLNCTFNKVNGRVPVVVGIGGNNTAEVIKAFSKLPIDKAVAILSVTPYYNKPSQEGLYQHYMALADAAPKPIVLYNVPGRTGRNMTAATTLRLASHPNIAGIKEAGPEMAQTIAILKDRPDDFLVVSGDDEIVVAQIACGMDGVVSVAANAFPKPFSDMIRFAMAGDFSMAKRINDLLVEAYSYMYEENNPAGVKAFMFEQEIIQNELRLPLVPVSEGLQKKIHSFVERF
ncbi:MAG: 4-hydroxy-tetrahydrodipicolinate synthase [Chitinophagaceae bacterium]|nr:MAG: 4-hydroxy-tetrahydrodipicolinate synthase [Chitinophagaceae bacterium]